MQDLFSQKEEQLSPLADRMRPRTLDELIGQAHLVGPGRLLRRAIEADSLRDFAEDFFATHARDNW